ncbi:hypothetical protein CGCVW01_v004508 [Colletotrichum viniferum]|nr:hypothetical protein CGCVW01_v004508 [Colletotrichum viniferum]
MRPLARGEVFASQRSVSWVLGCSRCLPSRRIISSGQLTYLVRG